MMIEAMIQPEPARSSATSIIEGSLNCDIRKIKVGLSAPPIIAVSVGQDILANANNAAAARINETMRKIPIKRNNL